MTVILFTPSYEFLFIYNYFFHSISLSSIEPSYIIKGCLDIFFITEIGYWAKVMQNAW